MHIQSFLIINIPFPSSKDNVSIKAQVNAHLETRWAVCTRLLLPSYVIVQQIFSLNMKLLSSICSYRDGASGSRADCAVSALFSWQVAASRPQGRSRLIWLYCTFQMKATSSPPPETLCLTETLSSLYFLIVMVTRSQMKKVTTVSESTTSVTWRGESSSRLISM